MNRWYFWVLAAVMLATGLALPFLARPPTWQGSVLLYVLCGVLVLATLGYLASTCLRCRTCFGYQSVKTTVPTSNV
jgi:hypothetical protein